MSSETPTDGPKRRLLRQIISPRPSVPPPPLSTTNHGSQENVLSGNQAVNSRSYRRVPRDTSFSNFVSEYEYVSRARTRAKTFGEAPSAERRARSLDPEANAGERVEARPSHQLPPVPSSNTAGLIETCEIPPCELSSTNAPEFMNPSPWYEGEVPIECLSTGSMAQAQRRRLRAQIRLARLVAEDVANPGFSPENLSILGWADPIERDGVAVNHAGESASNMAGSIFAVAPTAPDAGLYEPSPEPIVQTAPSNVHTAAQRSPFHEPFDTEKTSFDPTSRDSRASSSSSHSLFEYDHLVSDPARTVENPASLNPAGGKDVECERSTYDPVHQWFSLEKLNTQDATSSAEICERNVDSGWIESAGAKEESFVPVAPIPPPRVSHPENGRVVIKVTPPTPPITMPPQGHGSMNDMSHLTLPDLRPSTTGSAEADGRDIDTEWVESAGEIEARSSFPAAPIPPTTVPRVEPCNMVIPVTPPSPPTTIRPSLTHKYATRLGMNPDDSCSLSHHAELASSATQGDNPRRDFQQPAILAKPLLVKNYSRPFRPEPDQHVSSAAYVRPSKPTDCEVFMSLIEGETEAPNAQVKSEALSTSSPFGPSGEIEDQLTFFDMLALGGFIDDADHTADGVQDASAVDEAERSVNVEPIPPLSLRKPALSTSSPFGPSGETEDQLTFFDMLALGGTIDDADQTVDGEETESAADESEPSVSVEPVPALLSRKSATVNRSTKEPMPRPIHHRIRALTSRITSSLRTWGKAVSRSCVRRPAQPEGNMPFNPDFNSLEGFVPPQGSSSDCIGLNDALALPKSNVWTTPVTN